MYTTIIHPLRKALQLSCNEYIVLDLISRLSHNVKYNGWCIASKANIAKMTDLSERKIFTTIGKLVSLELIEKDDTTKHIRTTDKFNKLMAKHDNFYLGYKDKEESFFSGKPLYAESADTMQKVQTGYAESADLPMQKVHTTIITNNKINTTNPGGLDSSTLQSSFDSFYKLYPKKKAKADALRAFRKIKPAEYEAVIAGLKAQLPKLLATDPNFRPHPATWLNGRRWEDELDKDMPKTDEQYAKEYSEVGYSRFKTLYGKDLADKFFQLTMKI